MGREHDEPPLLGPDSKHACFSEEAFCFADTPPRTHDGFQICDLQAQPMPTSAYDGFLSDSGSIPNNTGANREEYVLRGIFRDAAHPTEHSLIEVAQDAKHVPAQSHK